MTQPPSGSDGPHVIVDSLQAAHLDADDDHHIRKVLRLRVGETLTLSDGNGSWQLFELGDHDIAPAGDVVLVDPPEVPLTIGFALTKGQKPELTVQKLTEIGIHRILPFAAERSVVRWDAERAERNVQRWRRVAREAAMQSRRVYLPEVAPVQDFAAVSALPGAVIADRDGAAVAKNHHTILVGPEGGWSTSEREEQPSVGLGKTVLRAETASFVAATLMMDRQHSR